MTTLHLTYFSTYLIDLIPDEAVDWVDIVLVVTNLTERLRSTEDIHAREHFWRWLESCNFRSWRGSRGQAC